MKDEFINRLGVWGRRHYDYLKRNKPMVINVMRTEGTLEDYLVQLDKDAQETYDLLIRQYAERDGINEALKEEDEMRWVREMNWIRKAAEEFVLSDMIYQ